MSRWTNTRTYTTGAYGTVVASNRTHGGIAGFEQGVIAESMLQAGFKSVRSKTVNGSFGPMDIDIGRK